MEELAQFNQHQQDARARLDGIAKSIFLIAGGTLTLSINAFTGKSAVELPDNLICLVKLSWGSLFASLLCFVLVTILVMTDMYFFGERWRKQLDGGPEAKGVNFQCLQLVLVAGGLLAFSFGLLGIGYTAINLI